MTGFRRTLSAALRRSAKVSRAPCARGQCRVRDENRESKVEGTSPWWPFACGYLELRPMTWRCCAARRMCRWQYATPGALQQLARASSMLVPADINVLCVSSELSPSPHAPEPASPSHAAPRQRSCANGGRTRVPSNQTRLQWPGGRPCIGNSRLTTGDSMVRRTAATLLPRRGGTCRSWLPTPVRSYYRSARV